MKFDIVHAFESFEHSGIIPKGCNCSFIALVPKVKDPKNLDEYKPISLVGLIYKILPAG